MNQRKNAASRSTDDLRDPMSSLHAACFPIERLGWRTRRAMATALRDVVVGQLRASPETARAVSRSAFHIDPDEGLGRSEILKALRTNGFKVPPKRLYGLLRKAHRAGLDETEVGITAAGRFVSLNHGGAIRARLIVRQTDHGVTFRLIESQEYP